MRGEEYSLWRACDFAHLGGLVSLFSFGEGMFRAPLGGGAILFGLGGAAQSIRLCEPNGLKIPTQALQAPDKIEWRFSG